MTISAKARYVHKVRKMIREIEQYASSIAVLSYNGSSYDINLVKKELFKQLGLTKSSNKNFVIKQNSRYPLLSTECFRFLDVMNYVSQGVSLDKFLLSYEIDMRKGYFPYTWFDCVEKLDSECLPAYDAFYSDLKKVNVLDVEYNNFLNNGSIGDTPLTGLELHHSLVSLWDEYNMKSFKDYLIYYNSMDVKPLVKAVNKMLAVYLQKNVDLFVDAISVSGVARRCLFNSPNINEKFGLFAEYEKDVHTLFKENIVGGPSIIFNRYQEKDVTYIRSNPDRSCRSIEGYDANSLYLWALSQKQPLGLPVIRRRDEGFMPRRRHHSAVATEWLEYVRHQNNIDLQTNTRGGEKRVGPYIVDGYCEHGKIVAEFLGCYWHGYNCAFNTTKDKKTQQKRYSQTDDRLRSLIQMGYDVHSIWECEWNQLKQHNSDVIQFVRQHFGSKRVRMSENDIISKVKAGELFGAVQCDIYCPADKHEYFHEMSPIFKTVDVMINDIGDHMREFEGERIRKRRTLVGGMKAKGILLATPLLKFYLEKGLIVENISLVVEYDSGNCFSNFTEKITAARRLGDEKPSTKLHADTAKLMGNSAYGSLLMRVDRHKSVRYRDSEAEVTTLFNNRNFRSFTKIDDALFEVEMNKKKISYSIPIQLGFFVLQLAKLRLLEFYYDFIDRYISRSNYQCCEMDTDSLYIALSEDKLVDSVMPHMKKSFDTLLNGHCNNLVYAPSVHQSNYYLTRTCCAEHSKHDSRTPGLFKLECAGIGIISLCSKSYCVKMKSGIKFSSKGVNKNALNKATLFDLYKQTLLTKQLFIVKNTGIRQWKHNTITYEQKKKGFSYSYWKRKVMADDVSTLPLDIWL